MSARDFGAILVLPAFVVAALWYPFGFALGGLLEEWDVLTLFSQNGVFYLATPSSPLAVHLQRPFTVLFQALAFTLDPNSFFYWHVILAASLVVKGASAAAIALYMTQDRMIAALLSLLVMLCPADTMQLSLRTMHISVAIALATSACALWLWSTTALRQDVKVAAALAAMILYLVAVLTYEVTVGFLILPLLAVFVRHGAKSPAVVRSNWLPLSIWAAGFLIWGAYYFWSFRQGGAYLEATLANASLLEIISRVPRFFAAGFYRAFYESWVDLIQISRFQLSDVAYPIGVSLVIASAFYLLDTRQGTASSTAIRMFVAGLALFAVCYVPFISNPALLMVTQRTFLTAALGASLILVSCFVLLTPWIGRLATAALGGIIIGVCFTGQLFQFDKYNRIYSEVFTPALSQLVSLLRDPLPQQPYIIIRNGYGYMSGIWDLGASLNSALVYLVPELRPREVFVCEASSMRLLPRFLGRGSCSEDAGSFTIEKWNGTSVTLDKRNVRVINIGPLAAEERSAIATIDLPPRAWSVLGASGWDKRLSLFQRDDRPETYRCEFESSWGYAAPCRTFGFHEGEPYRPRLRANYAWIGETRAGWIFDIVPTSQQYRLRVVLHSIASSAHQVGISVNNTPINYSWEGPLVLKATFAGGLMHDKDNVVELRTGLDPKLGRSLTVKRIEIRPESDD